MDEVRAYQYKNLGEAGINPLDYRPMFEDGSFTGTLDAKAWGRQRGCMMLFITLEQGPPVIACAWRTSLDHGQEMYYAGADDIPMGTRVKARFSKSKTGRIKLDRIRAIPDDVQ